MTEFGDEHRIFLQAIMARSIISSKDFHTLFEMSLKRCNIEVPGTATKNDCLRDFIKCINQKIEDLNLKIIKVLDEENVRKVSSLMLVNRSDRSSEATKLTVKAMVAFPPHELEYLKILIDHIMDSDMKQITQTYALNRVTEVKAKKVTQQEAEKLLAKFKNHQWLLFSSDSPNVRLSTRCIYELEPYLRDVYKDMISDCPVCQKMVVQSIKCENEECDAAYHVYCVHSLADRDEAKKIAKCKLCQSELPKKRRPSNFPARRVRDDDSPESRPRVGEKRRSSRIVAGLDSESESD